MRKRNGESIHEYEYLSTFSLRIHLHHVCSEKSVK